MSLDEKTKYLISLDENAQYYKKAFERLEKENKNTWNWVAFWLNVVWMIYRKMYLYAFMYYIAIVLFGVVGNFFEVTKTTLGVLLGLIWIVFSCCLGYLGNRLYYHVVKKRVSEGYHLLEQYCPTSLTAAVLTLMGGSIVLVPILWLADYMSAGRRLRHAEEVIVDGNSVAMYLNSFKKIPLMVKLANAIVIIAVVVFCYLV